MQRKVFVLYGLLAAAFLVWLYGRWDNEARQLHRRLDALGALMEKGEAESNLVAANKGRQAGTFFCRDFSIELRPFQQSMDDRARLAQVVLGYRQRAETIAVGFDGTEVEILPGQPKIADMTTDVTLSGRIDGTRRREAYRFSFRWLEEDGRWCIERAEMLEVLEGLESLL